MFQNFDYLQNLTANPYYENMLIDAVYLAAMMNAEVGTNYDISNNYNLFSLNKATLSFRRQRVAF